MYSKKIWIFVLGILFVGLAIFAFPVENVSSSTTGTFDSPIVFIGQTSIDLHWDHPNPAYDKYVLLRDGTPIFTTGTAVTFYRDTGLTEGTTYAYQITAYEEDELKRSGLSKSATAGEIEGILYQSKTWAPETYYLYGHIDIRPGVLFTIQPGAVVESADISDYKSISDGQGGQLNITNLAMETNVIVFQANSVVSGVTFSGGSTLYYERSDVFSNANTFSDATLILGKHTNATVTIQNQTFKNDAVLQITNGVGATIKQCDFNQALIDISIGDGGSASLQDNIFQNGGDSSTYGAPASVDILTTNNVVVNISDNIFDRAGIELYAPNAAVTIENNLMGGGTPVTTGIMVRSGDPLIQDNLISDYSYGIDYRSYSEDGGTATGNTLALNNTGVGIVNKAEPVIQDNCIAGNGEGASALYISQIVDMTGNWWGAASGPYHYPNNPDGFGNRVWGDTVDFTGWLTSDNCQAADLVAFDMEAVQVIGSEADYLTGELEPMPAAAGRETIVRAYAEALVGAVSGVEGELRAYREGAYLGMLDSENTVRVEAAADLEAQRGDLKNGAVYFELPAAWTIPGVLTYTVTLNPDDAPMELRTTNNTMTKTVTFTDQYPFRIAYVPILYSPGKGDAVPPSAGLILKGHTYMQSIFPHAEVEMGLFPAMTWNKQMKGAETKQEYTNGDELLNILSVILIKWNITHPPEERFNQIMGVFPGGMTEMISFGYSDPRWAEGDGNSMGLGLASYCWASGDCFAHEIGHNLGLRHTNVEGKDCFADDYDSYWKGEYSDNTIQTYGYHDVRDELIPKTEPDLMSFCTDTWISPLHWKMLLEANGVPQPAYDGEVSVTASASTAAQNAPMADTNYLLVRAWTSFEGVTEFLPFWSATSTSGLPVWTPDNGSEYCVRMEDGGGNVIEEKCMDAYFANHETQDWAITNHFIAALPIPTSMAAQDANNALADIAEISVYSNKFSWETATRQPSAHQPTVTLISPTAGAVLSGDTQITWSGTDADGDPLVYSIYYRPAVDAPWNPLAVDISETSYLAKLQDLPAGSAAQFKVEASDGYHVVAALSGNLSVPERGPAVYLLAPVADENYETTLFLSGYGYHPDFGLLPAGSLTWTSDQDGLLGTGDALTVTLSTGTHQVTLTGSFEDQTAMTDVSITVNPEPTAISGLTILGPDKVASGEPVTLEASVSAGTDVTYTWDFKDGTTATGKTVTHIFPFYEYSYNVKLTAVNALGLRTAYKSITIDPSSTLRQIYLPLLVDIQ